MTRLPPVPSEFGSCPPLNPPVQRNWFTSAAVSKLWYQTTPGPEMRPTQSALGAGAGPGAGAGLGVGTAGAGAALLSPPPPHEAIPEAPAATNNEIQNRLAVM